MSKQSRISLHLVVDQLSIAQDITSPVFMTALDHESWAFSLFRLTSNRTNFARLIHIFGIDHFGKFKENYY